MNFSGKITHSVISFLQAQGAEAGEIFESLDLPAEFLKDSTSWLDAHKVENLLQHIESLSIQKLGIERPLEKMGHAAKDLKSWGVLDSVLRMIEKPHDIFLQPQRFISYFISPAPPIANINRGENSVTFDVPISFEEYPRVATYLSAAIEAVPLFMGLQMAEAVWRQNSISINWRQTQSLLGEQTLQHRQMAPEVMQTLVETLEKTEQALREKTRELERIKQENTLAASSQVPQLEELKQFRRQYEDFHHQVLRLQDYFTRSQQLITILVGKNRLTSQVREAMKRVDWELVQESFPKVTRELLNKFENKPNEIAEIKNGEDNKSSRARDSRQPWLPYS
ncbi:MAG: hypothetical protein A2Z20_00950 [Bdellovibrionales bacterium RBG_16_40_8]|nr:MAG: hypothetical protein A2Z20_00950 [Bdellovibrionales bacterium RBG_16_40_8]